MKIVIDIETIPCQCETKKAAIMEGAKLTVPSALSTKPKLIEDMGLGEKAKFQTVQELKDLWVERNADSAKEEAWKRTALEGAHGEIVSFAASCLDGDIKSVVRGVAEPEGEFLVRALDLLSTMSGRTAPEFIAHNKKFDLPFLYKRLVINKVRPSFYFDPHGRHHDCTMEMWEGFGGRISLNNLCAALGLDQKSGEGCQVFEWWDNGDTKKIEGYNRDDVRITLEAYKMMTFAHNNVL